MKIRSILFSFSVLYLSFTMAQNVCSDYYPMAEDTKFKLTSFKPNGKITSATNYLITNSENTALGQNATYTTEIEDDKGEVTATASYDVVCENGVVLIDFRSLMGPDVYSQFPDMEMEVSGTALEFPNNLQEGQSLPDADLLAVINMSPIKMRLTFIMTNRQVVGQETITTPAGTFECIVITYDYESKFGVKVTGSTKQWLAKGVGLVKQEDMNKKGKMISYIELTAFAV